MRAVLALALVACGTARTPAAKHLAPDEHRDSEWKPPAGASGLEPLPAELPILDIDPDPADWRWPLPRAPQVSPSGELAAMFGAKGIWTTLCAARRDPRGVDRDEALAYLRAWCDLPPDLALAKALVPQLHARTMELALAARIDLATVLESQVAAKEALEWLRANGALDDFVIDALAATYLANDRLDDSRVLITYLKGIRSWGATPCRRLFRELFVADRDRRNLIRTQLSVSKDAVCSRLSSHANCTLSWGVRAQGEGVVAARHDLDRCTPLLLEKPALLPEAYLTIAADHWPQKSLGFEGWLAFATFTTGAIGAPRADELIAAAFTNAIRVSNCESQLDQVIELVAHSTYDRVRNLSRTTRSDCLRRSGSPPR